MALVLRSGTPCIHSLPTSPLPSVSALALSASSSFSYQFLLASTFPSASVAGRPKFWEMDMTCVWIFGHLSLDDPRGMCSCLVEFSLWSELLLVLPPVHHLLLDVHWYRQTCEPLLGQSIGWHALIRCHLALSLESDSRVLCWSVPMRREEAGPGGRQQWCSPDFLSQEWPQPHYVPRGLLLLMPLPRNPCRSCPAPGRIWERWPRSAFQTLILTQPLLLVVLVCAVV